MRERQEKGIPLHTKILLALILGAAFGIGANYFQQPAAFQPKRLALLSLQPGMGLPFGALAAAYAPDTPTWIDHVITYVMRPAGEIFLRMLFLTVIPLVFSSLAVGVAQLGAMGNLGRIGLKTFAYFVLTMTCAVVIGLTLVNLLEPGRQLPKEVSERLLREYGSEATRRTGQPAAFGIDTFVNIVPRNPLAAMVNMDMLAVIFFALLIGIGLTRIEPERSQHVVRVLEGVNELMVVIIGWAMKIAPFGVFALIFATTARFGFDLLKPLAFYILIVIGGLALQMFGVLSVLVAVLARLSPLVFFSKVRSIIVTAFSTSSSNATLPTSIKVSEEELGVPPAIAGFVLPLGATMNMNGTALFEGVTVVFLAQVFGVELSLGDQIIVVVMAVITAIGAAGVPGGSLPLLVMVLAMVGVPEMGIALILGVDRILDMCRTTLNVIGDVSAAAYVARSEGYELKTEGATP
ncbi:MAG: dicarboxylate/amino acid:cation symporter [Gemmataceae bacterium]|nr:dicarboxylate/amino acid:cation symporter [Gemmataceae bacterium]